MKHINTRTLANGRRRVTVELTPDETLMPIRDGFYKLGGQVDDIVSSSVLNETVQVTWCSVSQKWVE